jgi:FkbM family methyltransferase
METQIEENRLRRWRRKLRERGLRKIITGRLQWYWLSFRMDNWLIGRLVELGGNRVKLHGLDLSLDNPLISTRHKSTIFFGIYETAEIELSRRYLDLDRPTIELGGSIGVVACVTNRMLKRPSDHIVVEANPVLLPLLEENRRRNDCRFAIEAVAIGYGTDTIEFTVQDHFLFGRLQSEGGRRALVPTASLGKLIQKYGFESINLLSDIEGTEVALVENEPEVLRSRVKNLIMETHEEYLGEGPIVRMLATLKELGFELRERSRETVVALTNRNL